MGWLKFINWAWGLKLVDLNKNKLVKNFADIYDIVWINICTTPKYGKYLITKIYKEINISINKNLIKK